MAKKLKLNIKNTQLAEAVNIGQLKNKLAAAKKEKEAAAKKASEKKAPVKPKTKAAEPAKSKAAENPTPQEAPKLASEPAIVEEVSTEEIEVAKPAPAVKLRSKTAQDLKPKEAPPVRKSHSPEIPAPPRGTVALSAIANKGLPPSASKIRLGPTGKHINDILPPKKKAPPKPPVSNEADNKPAAPKRPKTPSPEEPVQDDRPSKKKWTKEYKNLRPRSSAKQKGRQNDLKEASDEGNWRKRRPGKKHSGKFEEDPAISRPTELTIRLPITVKNLAQQMKIKVSEIISKLFMEGLTLTLNDFLDDETTVQLIGDAFACQIGINNQEEERIRITEKSIQEEILEAGKDSLTLRAPVITFMGHVDHGKTSLIDNIRRSNVAAHEAGAITQHIGAFRVDTDHGPLTFLDTPGHEAFTAMRERGAKVTDIVVLVVAGDEGFRQQTEEALQHAKAAGVVIVVAINKCDKPGFDPDTVLRQLADRELLPESWGGTTITVNCSAKSGEGIPELLELLALQAEILELKANPEARARGTVLESEMHKGLGASVSMIVQNGSLKQGDALVFDQYWARVKTMKNCSGKSITSADPSTPVEITGLSGLPEAGEEFIVVANEKEAKEIAEARQEEFRQKNLQKRSTISMESLFQQAEGDKKKLLLILRADVQGSLEALKASIENIESEKVEVDIIFTGVGEISESDVRLASASNAVILGFHTRIENHAADLIKEAKIVVKTFDIIYHAVDGVKEIMSGLLDKLEVENEMGQAYVQAIFKASQLGVIAGCLVKEGLIKRGHIARIFRDDKEIWKGKIASLKRNKDDVREVKKDLECGILLDGYNQVAEGDIIKTYEIEQVVQEL